MRSGTIHLCIRPITQHGWLVLSRSVHSGAELLRALLGLWPGHSGSSPAKREQALSKLRSVALFTLGNGIWLCWPWPLSPG